MIKIIIGAVYKCGNNSCYNMVTNGVTNVKSFNNKTEADFNNQLDLMLIDLNIIPYESQRQYDNNDLHRMAASHEARSLLD